jgi:alkylhydroperoxidase family enzyme
MSLLELPEPSAEALASFDDDLAQLGFVMNGTRLWAYEPLLQEQLFGMLGQVVRDHGLNFRQRAILVTACASALGDAYCSVAWGTKLASVAGEELAASVLRGDDVGLSPAESALSTWARQVARDPNGTTAADVSLLQDTGWTDRQIFGITVFVALRIAFSTVNDALGAQPDAAYLTVAPAAVLKAITFGRPFAD